jgi:hypothetical protein
MKFVEPSHFSNPNVAARKLVEIANGIDPPRGQCKKRLDIVALPQQLFCSIVGNRIFARHAGTSL